MRPGPLAANMDKRYALRKKGEEEAEVQLRDTEDITGDTYNAIIYQEQVMLIAKKVAKFNDSQSDSILRKAIAKKSDEKMELSRRLFIYGKKNEEPPEDYDEENLNQCIYDPKGKYGTPILGGVNNGYTEEELTEFWKKLKSYSSYLFNKSHSASYAVVTLCTLYLKTYYPSKFFAALLSMTDIDKINNYAVTMKQQYNISLLKPDVNTSIGDFKEINNNILYGFNAMKGVGPGAVEEIINNRPLNNVEDALNKIPKKILNKKVLTALIESGSFDFEDNNRYRLLNHMYDLRKDKDDRMPESLYCKDACMSLENKTLSTNVTYIPKWYSMKEKSKAVLDANVISIYKKKDKNGNMMVFLKILHEGVEISSLAFASTYRKYSSMFKDDLDRIIVEGYKSDRNFIINKVIRISTKTKTDYEEVMGI